MTTTVADPSSLEVDLFFVLVLAADQAADSTPATASASTPSSASVVHRRSRRAARIPTVMRVDDIPRPNAMAAPRLFLIDGSNQMYRAYHAHPRTDRRRTASRRNAVYGFVTMLRKLIADHKPEFIAASFDLAGPTFRRDLAADYKANRAPMPPDLVEQVPLVHEACARARRADPDRPSATRPTT